MRHQGTITSWNDALGIGFVRPLDGGKEVAIRFDDFTDRSRAPAAGLIVTYDLNTDPQGRPAARRITLPQVGMATQAAQPIPTRPNPARQRKPWLSFALVAAAAVGLAVWWQANMSPADAGPSAAITQGTLEGNDAVFAQAQPYQCDGRRRCDQMTSCAEAQYFFQHCAARDMDTNGDGVACDMELRCY